MKSIAPWLGFAPIALLIGIAIWDRFTQSTAKKFVLIRVGDHPMWTTRPPLITTAAQVESARNVATQLETMGFTAKSLVFLGTPTMDLIVESEEPEQLAPHLAQTLRDVPVVVRAVGRPGDLIWFSRLWRHM
jgi:hypothetical protein